MSAELYAIQQLFEVGDFVVVEDAVVGWDVDVVGWAVVGDFVVGWTVGDWVVGLDVVGDGVVG